MFRVLHSRENGGYSKLKKVNTTPKEEETESKKIPVLEILSLGAFQVLYGNPHEMIFTGTRATLLFNNDNKFFELAKRYSQNEPVPVIEFCNIQRQLKAQMYAGKKGNVNGNGG